MRHDGPHGWHGWHDGRHDGHGDVHRRGLVRLCDLLRRRDRLSRGQEYTAKWWTQNNVPGAEQYGPWQALGTC